MGGGDRFDGGKACAHSYGDDTLLFLGLIAAEIRRLWPRVPSLVPRFHRHQEVLKANTGKLRHPEKTMLQLQLGVSGHIDVMMMRDLTQMQRPTDPTGGGEPPPPPSDISFTPLPPSLPRAEQVPLTCSPTCL